MNLWDIRPYAVLGNGSILPAGMARYDRNSGKWYDSIRGDKGGFMISERVAEIIKNSGAPFGNLREYPPFLPTAFGEIAPPPVKYFHWIPVDELLVDDEFLAQGVSGPIMRWIPQRIQTGALYCLAKGLHSGCLCCDIRFLALARRHKFSNFWFRPIDLPNSIDGPPYQIKYMESRWPPQWYPDGFEPHPNNLIDDIPPDPLRRS